VEVLEDRCVPTVSFGQLNTLGADLSSSAVAVGDLNGDGMPDMVVANSITPNGTVSVFLNDGHGGFGAATQYAAGNNPKAIVLGDFNGDGKLDIAVGDKVVPWGTVAVLFGDGHGSFSAPTFTLVGPVVSLAAGDFNGDGHLDLVAIDQYAGYSAAVELLNNGQGGFQQPRGFYTDLMGSSVAAADFNGDGKLDLAIANSVLPNGYVTVLDGDGQGGFTKVGQFASGINSKCVAVGDLNGDGRPDLVVADTALTTGGVGVLLNNGQGGFLPVSVYGAGTNPWWVAVGDFNGDGNLDVVAANNVSPNGGVSVLEGDGHGHLGTPQSFATGNAPYAVAVGDFNHDGKPDLVTANNITGTAGVLLNTTVFLPPPPPANLAAAAHTLVYGRESFADFVTAAYQKYLGRTPDAQGLNAWVSALQGGMTDEQLEASFIGSNEYITNHGGRGAGWVEGMYHDLLNRTPSDTEVQAWVSYLSGGGTPYNVAFGFAASAEREGLRVTADYQTYLGRTPTSAEKDAWVSIFLKGYRNEDVVAGFLSSPEYYRSMTKGKGDKTDWVFAAYHDVLARTPTNAELTAWLTFLQ
jgi:hypothetical protein